MSKRLAVPCVALLLSLMGLIPQRLWAQAAENEAPVSVDANLEIRTLPLWKGKAPGAQGTGPNDTPTLTLFRPVHPNGTAIIVAPGGAYIHLAGIHEGRQPADRLAELGITVFVLRYRLGPAYRYPVPLDDARRAVRLVRSMAATYGYSPDRIGMMGFSAGGHLAATAGVLPEDGKPESPDPVERLSSRLNFMVLVYPWLNAMQPQVPNPREGGKLMINYCSVAKGFTQDDCRKLDPQYTPVHHVDSTTPPAFVVATDDDTVVPVMTSVEFYTAMHRAADDVELHLFDHGPHGFGTAGDSETLSVWQDLLRNWLRAHGWLTPLRP